MDALDAIFGRRSTGRLAEPAPSAADLETILSAAACAPDHDELRPWRFLVLEGGALDAFGEVLANAYDARCARTGTEPVDARREKERTKLRRAPMVVVVAAVRHEATRIPWIEQVEAVAAATENALIAATALGYGSMWRSGDPSFDDNVKIALGLHIDDEVVGWLYLGSFRDGVVPEPRRGSLDGVVSRWQPPPAPV